MGDPITGNPALRNEVHYGKEQEGLVRCTIVGNLRIPVPAFVGPEISEHLEVFLKHCLRPPIFKPYWSGGLLTLL